MRRGIQREEWSKGGKPPVDLGFNFNSLGAAGFGMITEVPKGVAEFPGKNLEISREQKI